MKKILLIFILLSPINLTFAQTIKYTVIAGVNESTASDMPTSFLATVSAYGQKYPNSRLLGFHIGLLGEYQFSKISIQSGVLYTTKGGIPYKFSNRFFYYDYYESAKYVLRLDYLEIPINALYNISLRNSKIFIGGGPYVAMGISGKQTSTIIKKKSPDKNSKETVSNESDNIHYGDDIKRIDYGLDAKLGLILRKKWVIGLTYDYGLNDISDDSRFSGKNKSLSLSLGYAFK